MREKSIHSELVPNDEVVQPSGVVASSSTAVPAPAPAATPAPGPAAAPLPSSAPARAGPPTLILDQAETERPAVFGPPGADPLAARGVAPDLEFSEAGDREAQLRSEVMAVPAEAAFAVPEEAYAYGT